MADGSECEGAGQDVAPHLEVLDRVKNIPVIQSAIEKAESTWCYLKCSHHLVNWALNFAETGFGYATKTAAPLATPVVKRFESQIKSIDEKLCGGLDTVEEKVPIVNKQPEEIYNAAKAILCSPVQPAIDKIIGMKNSAAHTAVCVKDASVATANEILNTHYGSKVVEKLDNTNDLVNCLLDCYFPAVVCEPCKPEPISAEENKAMHSLQVIGRLSGKTASRVYHSVIAQLRILNKEDIAAYISNVVSILHLTQFLCAQKSSCPDECDESDECNESDECDESDEDDCPETC